MEETRRDGASGLRLPGGMQLPETEPGIRGDGRKVVAADEGRGSRNLDTLREGLRGSEEWDGRKEAAIIEDLDPNGRTPRQLGQRWGHREGTEGRARGRRQFIGVLAGG